MKGLSQHGRANRVYDVILLDQGKTFMFENDRFGHDVDYAVTYRELGGRLLSDIALRNAVTQLFEYFQAAYCDPERADSFPTIAEAIAELTGLGISDEDRDRIDELFAHHEAGSIAPRHVAALRSLARNHRLGVVSNIWASPRRFVTNLVDAGVCSCFEHLVWSSEHQCLKPTPRLFERALALFQVRPERVLFVGDDAIRDIDAAKSLGMSAAWVTPGAAPFPEWLRAPDLVIEDLAALPALLEERPK